jgi:HD-GYP domain-containing protein (c-di-GMP phosphodiesterase class II)
MEKLLKEILETPEFIKKFEENTHYAVPFTFHERATHCANDSPPGECEYCRTRQSELRLIRNLEELIELLVAVSEIHDPYTINHEKSCGTLAGSIALNLELPLFEVAGIIVGGYMHDVGKVAIPTDILTKPGKLSEEEFMLVKTHPIYGYRLLSTITLPWDIAGIALMHHERLDGSGYPRKLKCVQIPMSSQIVAIADVVEAMSSTRPYRGALSNTTIIDHLEQNKGMLYNKDACEVCITLLKCNK